MYYDDMFARIYYGIARDSAKNKRLTRHFITPRPPDYYKEMSARAMINRNAQRFGVPAFNDIGTAMRYQGLISTIMRSPTASHHHSVEYSPDHKERLKRANELEMEEQRRILHNAQQEAARQQLNDLLAGRINFFDENYYGSRWGY